MRGVRGERRRFGMVFEMVVAVASESVVRNESKTGMCVEGMIVAAQTSPCPCPSGT